MRMKLTKAVVGLGLAGALFLGAGAAAAPAAGAHSSAAPATTPPPNAPQRGPPASHAVPSHGQGPFQAHGRGGLGLAGAHRRPERPAERPDRRHRLSRPERVAGRCRRAAARPRVLQPGSRRPRRAVRASRGA